MAINDNNQSHSKLYICSILVAVHCQWTSLLNEHRKRSGFALKIITGSSAVQRPQPAKILTIRSSWLAQSFCRLPHNPPFCCFFLSHFLQSTLLSQWCFFKTTVSIHARAEKDIGNEIYLDENWNPMTLYIDTVSTRSEI